MERKVRIKHIEKQFLISELEDLLSGIMLQHHRVLNGRSKFLREIKNQNLFKRKKPSMGHDADFYFILSRRAYRFIELLANTESKIANLKGKNHTLLSKLKIRDTAEHWEGWGDFPFMSLTSRIKMRMGFTINRQSIFVQSGSYSWDFNLDNASLVKTIDEALEILRTSKIEEYIFESS